MEVELAGNQEDHGRDRRESRESAGAAFDCLEQSFERFEKSIGLTSLRPRDDALEMPANERCDISHRLDLGAHDAGANEAMRHERH